MNSSRETVSDHDSGNADTVELQRARRSFGPAHNIPIIARSSTPSQNHTAITSPAVSRQENLENPVSFQYTQHDVEMPLLGRGGTYQYSLRLVTDHRSSFVQFFQTRNAIIAKRCSLFVDH
jgi:hypothetical protein